MLTVVLELFAWLELQEYRQTLLYVHPDDPEMLVFLLVLTVEHVVLVLERLQFE